MDNREHAALMRQKEKLVEIRRRRLLMEQEIDHIHERSREVEDRIMRRSVDEEEKQQRVLAKLQDASRLEAEATRTYGANAHNKVAAAYVPSPGPMELPTRPVRMLNDVMRGRNEKRRDQARHRHAYMQSLNQERDRLVKLRNNLLEKKKGLRPDSTRSVLSDIGGHRSPYSSRASMLSVQSAGEYVGETRVRIPGMEDKLNFLRRDYDSEWRRRVMPYNGELGIDSYAPWQIDDYHLCRGIVDEMVEAFLDEHFRRDPTPDPLDFSRPSSKATSVAPSSKTASPTPSMSAQQDKIRRLKAENERQLRRAKDALIIGRLVNLTVEDVILEVTGDMCEEAAGEFIHIEKFVTSRASLQFYRFIEGIATQVPEGYAEDDYEYNQVTKQLLKLAQNRETTKQDVWSHSQVTDFDPEADEHVESLRIGQLSLVPEAKATATQRGPVIPRTTPGYGV